MLDELHGLAVGTEAVKGNQAGIAVLNGFYVHGNRFTKSDHLHAYLLIVVQVLLEGNDVVGQLPVKVTGQRVGFRPEEVGIRIAREVQFRIVHGLLHQFLHVVTHCR